MNTYPEIVISTDPISLDYQKELLRDSKLEDYSSITDVWDIPHSSIKLAYLTHSIFRFFGKFPPPVARGLISRYTKIGDMVFDPMCGSGTTALECLLMDRKVVCSDVSVLSELLVNVKCQYVKGSRLKQTLSNLNEKYKKLSSKNYDLKIPFDESRIEHWYLPQTFKNLQRIKSLINDIDDEITRRVFDCIFISIIRKVSKATSLQGRLFLDVKSAQSEPIIEFNKSAEKIIKAVSALPENFASPRFIREDVRHVNFKEINPKLIICHPPYFNVYKFSTIFSLELPWLGISNKELSKNEVREFFKIGKEENVHKYVDDMADSIRALSSQINKKTYFSLMIGDTRLRGKHIPTTRLLLDCLRDIDLELINIAIRRPKFTEASWVASQRREGDKVGIVLSDFILTFEKKK
ncbi:MAG TPA: DNA methyltransferase [Candidatus Omnitrophota bacterium]|nr:DNA methyltransferase [Candidatus Omnitrophota bacterium]HPS19726.1 DNA methyltransferase [Candidatus Omnitrophota bacterium]